MYCTQERYRLSRQTDRQTIVTASDSAAFPWPSTSRPLLTSPPHKELRRAVTRVVSPPNIDIISHCTRLFVGRSQMWGALAGSRLLSGPGRLGGGTHQSALSPDL